MMEVQELRGDVFLALAWIGLGKLCLAAIFEVLVRSAPMRRHRVFLVPIPSEQLARELKSSWHVISDALVLGALIATGLIRLVPTGAVSLVITFLVFYCWVESWYYFGHRLMHRSKFLYQFHRTHHVTKVVTPMSSMSMSLFEKSVLYTGGWLGFMSLISWLLPISLGGLVAYYTFHFLVSLHGHSNTEASPAGLLMTAAGMGSATSHALHHARPNVNYGFSNMFWDRILGTYDSQTYELQRNAIHGNGSSQLRRVPDRGTARNTG